MASSSREGDAAVVDIRLWREGTTWIAKDLETGVTTQGETRAGALRNLDEAVALYAGETGREPSEDELRAVGIDPADNTTGDREPPDILR